MEQAPKPEKLELSPDKEELLRLEQTGEYVFHGTGADLDELHPQQAIDIEKGPDGSPAVFASSKADYAIFMAIVHKKNAPEGTHSKAGATSFDDGSIRMKFGATQKTLDQLQESASGWVYVFDAKDFAPRPDHGARGVEYVSYKTVQPVQKILVHKADLPEEISVIE